jgi:hypothetical protein
MSIVELSISNWNDEVLLADTLVIIEFWHDTCGWCKRLEEPPPSCSFVKPDLSVFSLVSNLKIDLSNRLKIC